MTLDKNVWHNIEKILPMAIICSWKLLNQSSHEEVMS